MEDFLLFCGVLSLVWSVIVIGAVMRYGKHS